TFSGPVTLLASPSLTVNNATTFSGVIGESGGARSLTFLGIGTATLSNGGNYYSGGTTLSMAAGGVALGTLVAGAATALGTGTLTLTAGNYQSGGIFAIANPIAFGTGGIVIL